MCIKKGFFWQCSYRIGGGCSLLIMPMFSIVKQPITAWYLSLLPITGDRGDPFDARNITWVKGYIGPPGERGAPGIPGRPGKEGNV